MASIETWIPWRNAHKPHSSWAKAGYTSSVEVSVENRINQIRNSWTYSMGGFYFCQFATLHWSRFYRRLVQNKLQVDDKCHSLGMHAHGLRWPHAQKNRKRWLEQANGLHLIQPVRSLQNTSDSLASTSWCEVYEVSLSLSLSHTQTGSANWFRARTQKCARVYLSTGKKEMCEAVENDFTAGESDQRKCVIVFPQNIQMWKDNSYCLRICST